MNYLTTNEAADELGVNASRIRQLILSGVVQAQKAGRDWLISPEELEKARSRAKRGRPPKAKAEGNPPPKRPRGRPRKEK